MARTPESSHVPVMDREVIEYMAPGPGGVYVDGTLGAGGHSLGILEKSSPDGRLIGIDRDPAALALAGERLGGYAGRIMLERGNFKDLRDILAGAGVERVDGVLLDLGLSSMQLETPGRGFSFSRDEPLDMRMDPDQAVTAAELVNTLSAAELATIFREYGEERYSRRVARRIVEKREAGPIETTGRLAEIVSGAVPRRPKKGPERIHPATRVFQALRIAVNRELEGLDRAVEDAVEATRAGGRVVVITFHSLEDRIVKTTFRDLASGCVCPPRAPVCTCDKTPQVRVLTKRPVNPSPEEVERNPRARSAKLRAVERLPEG